MCYGYSNPDRLSLSETVSDGQFDWGGRLLKGNGGAQRLPQRGWKPRSKSAKAEGSLTARPTSRADTKVGLSDQAIQYGMVVA